MAGREHCAVAHIDCAFKDLDGATCAFEKDGMSAPVKGGGTHPQRVEIRHQMSQITMFWPPSEIQQLNSCASSGCAEPSLVIRYKSYFSLSIVSTIRLNFNCLGKKPILMARSSASLFIILTKIDSLTPSFL